MNCQQNLVSLKFISIHRNPNPRYAESLHNILKSGIKIEECRIGTADRLIRYLTLMSVIAWRIFFIILVSRANPNVPCTSLLANEEWKVDWRIIINIGTTASSSK
jgi:hypothetical protein